MMENAKPVAKFLQVSHGIIRCDSVKAKVKPFDNVGYITSDFFKTDVVRSRTAYAGHYFSFVHRPKGDGMCSCAVWVFHHWLWTPFSVLVMMFLFLFSIMDVDVEVTGLVDEFSIVAGLFASKASGDGIGNANVIREFMEGITSVGFIGHGIYSGKFAVSKNLGAFVTVEGLNFRKDVSV